MLQVTLCATGGNMDLIPQSTWDLQRSVRIGLRYRLENSDRSVDSGFKESCSGPEKSQ